MRIFAGLALILIGGVCTAAQVKHKVADPADYLKSLTAEMTKHWPRNRTINVVCHGHSVPAGYFKTPLVDSLNAYPHLLHAALKKRFPNAVINVIVTAIGGETSTRICRTVLSSDVTVGKLAGEFGM